MYILFIVFVRPTYGKIIKMKKEKTEKMNKREYYNTYLLIQLLEENKKMNNHLRNII